ncbi:MAG: hypothetical protein MZU97_17460 [Bacillus subtilis]|nr:hypothetical protein [Bacillus subtilis]
MYDPYTHAQTVLSVIKKHNLPFKVMIGVEPGGEISNPNCPWGGLQSDRSDRKTQGFQLRAARFARQTCERVRRHRPRRRRRERMHVGLAFQSDGARNDGRPCPVSERKRSNSPSRSAKARIIGVPKDAVIAKEVDFIAIHSYPVWHKIPFAKAVERRSRSTRDTVAAVSEQSRSSSPNTAGPPSATRR